MFCKLPAAPMFEGLGHLLAVHALREPWRLVACAISWPSTVARPASVCATGRMPV